MNTSNENAATNTNMTTMAPAEKSRRTQQQQQQQEVPEEDEHGRRRLDTAIHAYLTLVAESCGPQGGKVADETHGTAPAATATATAAETEKSPFDAVSVPQSLFVLLERMRTYRIVGAHCLYAGLVYMHHYLHARRLALRPTNVRGLFLVAVMLATKFLDDVSYNAATFASMADIPLRALLRLEADFLHALGYNCCVSLPQIQAVAHQIPAFLARHHPAYALPQPQLSHNHSHSHSHNAETKPLQQQTHVH
eukprot:TRINITY_DN2920_c0_g1_i1.p1 TRINITY_DN2920_c0_g1~~TRINITY_DN2920_c0_g1_i1.p1  ORF type:complete len:251 (-),score=51.49 TRINITY_DN2920_c0_g1_i1:395-1147(-)